MRYLWILGLVFMACNRTGKGSADKNQSIDSLRRYMTEQVVDYRNRDLWDSASNYLNALDGTVQRINNTKLTLYWRLQKVQQLLGEYRFDSASMYMNMALSLLHSNNLNYKDSFNSYIVFLHLLKEQNLYDSALRIGNQAYYVIKNDSSRLPTICWQLAQLYAAVDDLPNVRKYTLKAWQFKDQEPEWIPDIAKLIMYYFDKKNNDDSAIYYLKILQAVPTIHPSDAASVYENTGLFLVRKGRLQEGLQNLLKAKYILDTIGIKSSSLYNNLADTYKIAAQYGKASTCADSSILFAQLEQDYIKLSLAWRTKSEVYLETEQYKKAYAALDSSYTYYSEQADSSLRKTARELETKYAVREKDNEITSLAITNQASLKIRNQQKLIIFTIIIVIVLIGIIFFQFWRRRQAEMKSREILLKQQLLRTQMEPHFIFNTLATLQSLIRSGASEQAIGYLTNLAKLMRFNFENAQENFVLLKSEVEALDSYLNLQTMYRPELFDYDIKVYEGFEDDEIFIPPMLLQPFLENAILHGFSKIDHKGHLNIKIEKRHFALLCIIEDNGRGLQPAHKNNKIRSTIINQERLQILEKQTGSPASLSIIDKSTYSQQGILVEIEIPFKTIKERKELLT